VQALFETAKKRSTAALPPSARLTESTFR
jgi:hypothetical protein